MSCCTESEIRTHRRSRRIRLYLLLPLMLAWLTSWYLAPRMPDAFQIPMPELPGFLNGLSTERDANSVLDNGEFIDINLPDGDIPTGWLFITGLATPNREVQLVMDENVVATTETDSEGFWSTEIGFPSARVYELKAQTVNAEGDVLRETDVFSVNAVDAP